MRRLLALVVLCGSFAACGGSGGSGATLPAVTSKATILVRSAAFADDTPIPQQFTCDGAGASPPLRWSGAPAAARELALIVQDTDAGFTHWALLRIPPSTTSLAAGHAPAGTLQLKNDFGDAAYGGPCPPKGSSPHHYVFALYALDAPLKLGADASVSDATPAIADHTLARGEVTGTYRRGG
jgi:Raf kinase inhibitor-like YbhB/YbcL family protein